MPYLVANGFYMAGSCNCGGTYTQEWKSKTHKYMVVKVKPHKSVYEIILFDRSWNVGHIGNIEHKFTEALSHLERPFQ